jgi:hypothetical protein
MPRCPRCGTPNEADRVFCKYCGEKLTAGAPAAVAPIKRGLRLSDPRVLAGLVGLVAVLAIGGYAAANLGSPKATPGPTSPSLPVITPSAAPTAAPTQVAVVTTTTTSATTSETTTQTTSETTTSEVTTETTTETTESTTTEETTQSTTTESTATVVAETTATAIAFYAIPSEGAPADLYRISPDGGDLEPITTDDPPDSDPKWSPDGQRLAFDSTREDGQRNIWILEANGDLVRLTGDTGATNRFATWSPDGTKIAYEHNGQIWTVTVDNPSTAKRLTSGPTDSVPTWSKTNVIAFQRGSGGNSQVFTVAAAGGTPKLLIDNGAGAAGQPSWSANGKRIAYTRLEDGVRRIWVANADAQSGRKRLTTGDECPCQFPTWSPDGTQLAFMMVGANGNEQIAVIAATGGEVTPLTDESMRAFTPGWGT